MHTLSRLVFSLFIVTISVQLVGMEREGVLKKFYPVDGEKAALHACVIALAQGTLLWQNVSLRYKIILLRNAKKYAHLRWIGELAGVDRTSLDIEETKIANPTYLGISLRDCPSVLFPSVVCSRRVPGQRGEYGEALRKKLEQLDAIVNRLKAGVSWGHVSEEKRQEVLRHWQEQNLLACKYPKRK